MRLPPFRPSPFDEPGPFVRDETSGLVWHRCFARPLYADTDRSQVVYHANYLRYFELGRATLMRDVGFPYRKVEEDGHVYPIVDLRVQFHRPLHYDDAMYIHTRPVRLERVRVCFDYLITHGDSGAVACTGYTLHCALSRSGRPTAVDAQTVRMWERFPR